MLQNSNYTIAKYSIFCLYISFIHTPMCYFNMNDTMLFVEIILIFVKENGGQGNNGMLSHSYHIPSW